MMTVVGQYAELGDVSLHYEASGTGAPVVFLHGFSFDLRMWDDQVAALRGRYRVVRYDLRGFGKSGHGTSRYSHADDLAALLDYLGAKDVALVGLSLGGGAVINFAIGHPDRVRALVVVDPSLGGFSWSAEFTAELNNVRDVTRTSGVQDARERWLLSPLFAPALANPRSAKRLRTMVGDYSGWHWLNADLGRPFKPPAIERLGEIVAPTLVIVGELDAPDFRNIAATVVQTVSHARKVTLPGVGHLANLEDPDRFNDHLLRFLDSTHQGG